MSEDRRDVKGGMKVHGGRRKTLAIIDGKSVFYRGYYAMPYLSTKDGRATGGVYGFATLALEIISKLKPDYVAVAWDKSKTNIAKRTAIYPEYKANRKPAPADFYEQVPVLKELLSVLGWPLYELDGYEADDIMGSFARQAEEMDLETRLITSDLDLLQMVDAQTKVMNIKKGFSQIELVDVAAFEAKYGIKKEQFVDYKALVGDSSDNIPGVAGIGAKSAAELLQKYATLDLIYESLWEVKPAWATKLEAGRGSAYMSKELAEIFTDAPLKLSDELARMHGISEDASALRSFLEDLEFRTLLRNLPSFLRSRGANSEADEVGSSELKIESHAKKVLVKGPDDLKLSKDLPVYIYLRAKGKLGEDPERMYLSQSDEAVYIVDLNSDSKKGLNGQKGWGWLEAKLNSLQIVTYDSKKMLHIFRVLGLGDLASRPVWHDLQVAAFILNPLLKFKGLSELAAVEIQLKFSEEVPPEELDLEAAKVGLCMAELYKKQTHQLKDEPELLGVLRGIDQAVVPVLMEMEWLGMQVDVQAAESISRRFEGRIDELTKKIQELAGKEFNPASPKQLAEVLYVDLKLSPFGARKKKTGMSTAAAELEKMESMHPIIGLIKEYRQVAKLKSTYLDPIARMVDGSGRVHGSFNLNVAATGRLSSSDPNMQNIPIRSELGREVRSIFTAKEGYVLISADYSQVELRIAAAMSGDEELVEMFNDDLDIHRMTAAQLAGIDPEEVSDEQRYRAKAINFGILYGMGAHGLAVATGMGDGEARIFLLRYKKIRSKLFELTDGFINQAKERGYVATFYGRRRPTPDIKSSNFNVRSAAERAALNMPIQGTSADITKMAMTKLKEALPGSAQQVLQVHDSIVVEAPKKEAAKIGKLMKSTMEGAAPDIGVKLSVEIKVSERLE